MTTEIHEREKAIDAQTCTRSCICASTQINEERERERERERESYVYITEIETKVDSLSPSSPPKFAPFRTL